MAEVARRAGVGMATLYRNYPGRRQLLEAIFTDEVDELCGIAHTIKRDTPGATLFAWLDLFFAFAFARNDVAIELIADVGIDNSLFCDDRAKFCAAGRPLLVAAQQSGECRADLDIGQILDLIVAVAQVRRDVAYVGALMEVAFDGLRI